MTYKKALVILTVAVATLAAFAGVAGAATAITVGDGWHSFGSPDNSTYPQTFTFTAGGAVVVKVTDTLCPGDIYSVSDGSAPLGTTSAPGNSDPNCTYSGNTGDPDQAFADAAYSHGMWLLPAGTHSIDIGLVSSPFPGSGGYVRVDQVTKDMCKNGGWTIFGGASMQFRNQGQCAAVIARS
jgi:hypothetical protein